MSGVVQPKLGREELVSRWLELNGYDADDADNNEEGLLDAANDYSDDLLETEINMLERKAKRNKVRHDDPSTWPPYMYHAILNGHDKGLTPDKRAALFQSIRKHGVNPDISNPHAGGISWWNMIYDPDMNKVHEQEDLWGASTLDGVLVDPRKVPGYFLFPGSDDDEYDETDDPETIFANGVIPPDNLILWDAQAQQWIPVKESK